LIDDMGGASIDDLVACAVCLGVVQRVNGVSARLPALDPHAAAAERDRVADELHEQLEPIGAAEAAV
jgi:hypothetical protein